MRRLAILLFLLTCRGSLATAQSDAGTAFERLKTLVGSWDGKSQDGKAVHVSYQLFSDDSALLETIDHGGKAQMLTVYHVDRNQLMLTHYCMAHNQPRMRAELPSSDGKVLSFSFLDGANISTPSTGHMHKLVVYFEDDRHMTQKWTWLEKGQEQPQVFRFQRRE